MPEESCKQPENKWSMVAIVAELRPLTEFIEILSENIIGLLAYSDFFLFFTIHLGLFILSRQIRH